MNESPEVQLREWLERVSRAQSFHFRRYNFFRCWHLGIGVIVITGAIASAVLAFGLPIAPLKNAAVWAGIVSIFVTILASVQTFLKLRDLSDAHLKAAKEYNKLKITLEQFLVSPYDANPFKEFIDKFITQWKSVVDESPGIPPRLYKKAELEPGAA